jgi:signal transduction histidine kinase
MPRHDEGSSLQEAYSRLLSLAVHEFRTPASVVGGYLRMLQRDGEAPLSDRQRKMIDEAEKSCARLVGLIGELSEISKLDGGTAPFKDEPVDLFQLIREMAAGVHEAGERDVHLSVRGEESGARLNADPMRIRTAFDAFFRAILREQPGQATVVADCRRADAGAAVIVVARDTDVQLTYDAPRAPLDEKRGGLGLVVPIACRIVARYGGSVWSPALAGQSESGLTGRSALIISFPLAEQRS